ncbi:sigma-54 factor interaction domain-containing protein, partial [Intestinibacillus massiliensis]|nr:sigma-54 factor interaction domain-containing protein [Intestinibacillus massiliensis]
SYESLVIDNFFTNNGSFQKTLKALQSTAKYNINLLLLGETGVGKTLLAKKVHELSDYKDGRFVEVNCGALPENLIESELFGYERGAFTGADQKGKKGLFEVANGGTLFLDEVSELPMQSQAKLLKVLQDSQVRRIGGSQSIKIDCRIISATNKDLSREV